MQVYPTLCPQHDFYTPTTTFPINRRIGDGRPGPGGDITRAPSDGASSGLFGLKSTTHPPGEGVRVGPSSDGTASSSLPRLGLADAAAAPDLTVRERLLREELEAEDEDDNDHCPSSPSSIAGSLLFEDDYCDIGGFEDGDDNGEEYFSQADPRGDVLDDARYKPRGDTPPEARSWELNGPREYGPTKPSGAGGRTDARERRLWELHEAICEAEGAVTVEGSAAKLRYQTKAANSPWYPFRNLSRLLLAQFCDQYKVSRVMLEGILAMLRFVDVESGERFNVDDLEGVHHEHFRARNRPYLPLLQVVKRKVESSPAAKAAGQGSAESYDIPVNLVIDRLLRSSLAMAKAVGNQGGKQLNAAEVSAARLGSSHIFSSPEEPLDGAKKANLHGDLARSCPSWGFDGVIAENGTSRIYVGDVAMCTLNADQNAQPCRVVNMYWSTDEQTVVTTVRPFRLPPQVDSASTDIFRRGTGLRRMWEQDSGDDDVVIKTTALKDLCEVYARDEVDRSLNEHKLKEPPRLRGEEKAFIAEGFVRRNTKPPVPTGSRASGPKRGRRAPPSTAPRRWFDFKVSYAPWRKEGRPDDPRFSLRKE